MQNDPSSEPDPSTGETRGPAADAPQEPAVSPQFPASQPSEDGLPVVPVPVSGPETLSGEDATGKAGLPGDESAGADEAEEAPVASGEVDFAALEDLATRSQAARLSVSDEERMCELVKAALLGGKALVTQVGPVLGRMPWIVGVRAVETVWAAMKVTARTHLLRVLAEDESESGRRLRLSLARALFKLDPATGLKLLVTVCKELRDKETGAVPPRSAQVFNNVFIGKAKPWILQVSLKDLKPAEADLLVQCALCAAFSQPTPPVPLLNLLRWAGEADLLSGLPESTLAVLPKGLSRMSFKWQSAIRKEVANLPESILVLLKPDRSREGSAGGEAPAEEEAESGREDSSSADGEPGQPSGDSGVQDSGPEEDEEGEGDEEGEDADATGEAGESVPEEPRVRKPRPVYEPRPQRTIPRESGERREEGGRRERPVYQGRTPFNLTETLRQIEAHVQSLRTELSAAQIKLRQRDDDSRRERRPDRPLPLPGAPSNEELTRLNLQLEARIEELQARVEEISKDAEDRAASLGVHTGGPAPDPDQQLRALLGLKLQEDYADYLALENESLSAVVQQHYRTLLGHIFEVLKAENVPLQG